MKNVRFYCIALFCLFIVQLFVIGCAGTSAPSRFYTLHSLGDQKVTQNVPSSAHFLSIGISPVEIPDYLDRPQIVIKSGRNELKFAEFDRWAGSLRENIASVLAENLSLLLSTDQVFLHPGDPALDIDYSVTVNVLHLDSIPGEKVKLKALWMIAGKKGDKKIMSRISEFSEQLNGDNYEAMIAAMSRTLETLSHEIAVEIRANVGNKYD